MMDFDRRKFFTAYRGKFGGLNQSQVEAISALLDYFEDDPHMLDLRWIAYGLATILHETAKTFEAIDEYGSTAYFDKRYGPQTSVGRTLGNTQAGDGARFHGRGLVQLTGRRNFARLTERLKEVYPVEVTAFEQRTSQTFDLIERPEQAKDLQIAYLILSVGMREGIFTGKDLSDYINEDECQYVTARKIINGLDKAKLIAGYATSFEKILRAAVDDENEHADDDELQAAENGESETTETGIAPQPALSNTLATPAPTQPAPAEGIATIASSNTTQIGKLLVGGGVTAAGVMQWLHAHWILIAVIIACATAIYLTIYILKQKEKRLEATIKSDPGKVNVTFERGKAR